jgi:uncharacterized membrane protein YjfL (UPF0719 family)
MNDDAIWETLAHAVGNLPRDAAFVGLSLLLLFVARLVKGWLTPFDLKEQMTEKDNPAVGISVAGYYVGVLIVMMGPLMTPSEAEVPLWQDLLVTGGYALLGIVLLNLSRVIIDRVLLRSFDTVKELIEDRNVGTGAVQMGAYVASGLVVAGALYGQGGGPHTAVAMYALGQAGLLIYGWIYRLICGYDIHAEIEKDNVAAGVSLGFNLIAVGIVLMKGVGGDFVAWEVSLAKLGLTFVIGVVMLIVLRFMVDLLLLPGVSLRSEIVKDRNLNAAWVEGATLTGIVGVLMVIL